MNAHLVLLGLRPHVADGVRGRVAARRDAVPQARARTTSPGCGRSTRITPRTGPIGSWWPGAGYVTWVGIDGYYYHPSDTFASVFGKTIGQVRAITDKPVLLSETAVGPEAGQAAKIPDLFAGMRQYKTLGLVWFDIAQNDGLYHQDWRIENSPAAAGGVPGRGLRPAADPLLTSRRLIASRRSPVGRRRGGAAQVGTSGRYRLVAKPVIPCKAKPERDRRAGGRPPAALARTGRSARRRGSGRPRCRPSSSGWQ